VAYFPILFYNHNCKPSNILKRAIMNTDIIKKVEEGFYKKRPDVKVGDTVKLHLKVKEGKKERIQIFEGVVIAIKGSGLSKNLVVRKISYGVGVEKIVPLHTPVLEKIEVVKRGTVRRSKLYYLRGRVGKRALKTGETVNVYFTDEDEVGVEIPVTGDVQVPVTDQEEIEEGEEGEEVSEEVVTDSDIVKEEEEGVK
jgi:large subunit ribosomal protein L19